METSVIISTILKIVSPFLPFLIIALGAFLGIFLFWRAGKHEYIDGEFLFDIVLVVFFGAFLGGRVSEFLIRPDVFEWEPQRILFVNTYRGFDLYGALMGGILIAYLFITKLSIRAKRTGFWTIFDMAMLALVFGIAAANLGIYVLERNITNLFHFVGFFIIFFVLKRLALRKRHVGFFACFGLVALSVVNSALFGFSSSPKIFGIVPYTIIASLAILCYGSISWFVVAKRKPGQDIKGFFTWLFLGVLSAKNIVTSVGDADKFAKSILLSPFYFTKAVYMLIKKTASEVGRGLVEFMHVFGIKR